MKFILRLIIILLAHPIHSIVIGIRPISPNLIHTKPKIILITKQLIKQSLLIFFLSQLLRYIRLKTNPKFMRKIILFRIIFLFRYAKHWFIWHSTFYRLSNVDVIRFVWGCCGNLVIIVLVLLYVHFGGVRLFFSLGSFLGLFIFII